MKAHLYVCLARINVVSIIQHSSNMTQNKMNTVLILHGSLNEIKLHPTWSNDTKHCWETISNGPICWNDIGSIKRGQTSLIMTQRVAKLRPNIVERTFQTVPFVGTILDRLNEVKLRSSWSNIAKRRPNIEERPFQTVPFVEMMLDLSLNVVKHDPTSPNAFQHYWEIRWNCSIQHFFQTNVR